MTSWTVVTDVTCSWRHEQLSETSRVHDIMHSCHRRHVYMISCTVVTDVTCSWRHAQLSNRRHVYMTSCTIVTDVTCSWRHAQYCSHRRHVMHSRVSCTFVTSWRHAQLCVMHIRDVMTSCTVVCRWAAIRLSGMSYARSKETFSEISFYFQLLVDDLLLKLEILQSLRGLYDGLAFYALHWSYEPSH